MTLSNRSDDTPVRIEAVTTSDRNVVVTAGAGTGKTTLLVDRLIHLLMRDSDPLRLTEIVALTFTRKAADEMRIRLRERLHDLLEGDRSSGEEVVSRAREALRLLERSEIGTLHGFAATILRLYPLEAGLDPRFQEDDGEQFEDHFNDSWESWLDGELGGASPRKEEWKGVLRGTSLGDLRNLARRLCSETVSLQLPTGKEELHPAIREWLSELERRGSDLLSGRTENRNIEKLTRSAVWTFVSFLQRRDGSDLTEEEREALREKKVSGVKGWSESEAEEADRLVRTARNLLSIDGKKTGEIVNLLSPFTRSCREAFLRKGAISFDGLLVRARNLLRDHPGVREALKRRYRSILVDEFQDTDPIQYEILLFLAEEPERSARDWREVRLAPGKLFVVGDPKQSIYAFRRADMEAYLRVVREVIEAQEGRHLTLTGSFRSHEKVLLPVNGIFGRLIRPKEGLQAEYAPIFPASVLPPPAGDDQGMTLRLIDPPEERIDAEGARRLEGESLARWLAEEVFGKRPVRDRAGREVPIAPRHLAILMRSLTSVEAYLEPLRRYRIPYVVEGEKHLFATRPVIDAVHLLRTVANPDDTLALVGVLRSPLGGITDAALYALKSGNLLDYRTDPPADIPGAGRIGELYAALRRLHVEAPVLPAGEGVSRIFEALPLFLLTARSRDGEQGTANLEKIVRIAREEEGKGISLRGLISRLARWVEEGKEEGEGLLAEESVDAVRVMSIHKAKGLEFPMVILAGCQGGSPTGNGEKTEVWTDWSTGLTGIQAGDFRDLPSVFLSEKSRAREREEERRVFYVAMTRAREKVILSGVRNGKRNRGSFLSFLEEAIGEIPEMESSLSAGEGVIDLRPVEAPEGNPEPEKTDASPQAPEIDWEGYAGLWRKREERCRMIRQSPHFVTATGLMASWKSSPRKRGSRRSESWIPASAGMTAEKDDTAARIGTLAHRFLQEWDFSREPDDHPIELKKFLAPFEGEEEIRRELEEIFRTFFSSPAYEVLHRGKILGREVPWVMAKEGRVVEGVIDLLYETDGGLRGADYKTDRIDPVHAALEYRFQVDLYAEAAERGLGRKLDGFDLILLRTGERIPIR